MTSGAGRPPIASRRQHSVPLVKLLSQTGVTLGARPSEPASVTSGSALRSITRRMYKCICKRCGHRVNRLFIPPPQIGAREMFVCPECGHKSHLPSFSSLGLYVLQAGKCLVPLLAAAARKRPRTNPSSTTLALVAEVALERLRRQHNRLKKASKARRSAAQFYSRASIVRMRIKGT